MIVDQNGKMSRDKLNFILTRNDSYYLFYTTNVVIIVIDLVEITIDMIHVKVLEFHSMKLL